jgi:hypothetical protein
MARIQRAPAGEGAAPRWVLSLPPLEAALFVALPDQLAGLLADPDQNRRVIDRLFPHSYTDEAQEREHRELLGASLMQERRDMVAAVRAALAGARRGKSGLKVTLDGAGLDLLLRFINDTRLVIATDLGVDRNLSDMAVDPSSPDAPKFTLLVYLGGLEAAIVEALIGDPGY